MLALVQSGHTHVTCDVPLQGAITVSGSSLQTFDDVLVCRYGQGLRAIGSRSLASAMPILLIPTGQQALDSSDRRPPRSIQQLSRQTFRSQASMPARLPLKPPLHLKGRACAMSGRPSAEPPDISQLWAAFGRACQMRLLVRVCAPRLGSVAPQSLRRAICICRLRPQD